MEYLTLDLDGATFEDCMLRCFQLREHHDVCKIFWRPSSSDTGFHVEAYVNQLSEHEYTTRFKLGDDPYRLQRDIAKTGTGNMLADLKAGRKAGNWGVIA